LITYLESLAVIKGYYKTLHVTVLFLLYEVCAKCTFF